MYPGLGHVADAGVTGVAPGVGQGGVLDQQEGGGRGAWNVEIGMENDERNIQFN